MLKEADVDYGKRSNINGKEVRLSADLRLPRLHIGLP